MELVRWALMKSGVEEWLVDVLTSVCEESQIADN